MWTSSTVTIVKQWVDDIDLEVLEVEKLQKVLFCSAEQKTTILEHLFCVLSSLCSSLSAKLTVFFELSLDTVRWRVGDFWFFTPITGFWLVTYDKQWIMNPWMILNANDLLIRSCTTQTYTLNWHVRYIIRSFFRGRNRYSLVKRQSDVT